MRCSSTLPTSLSMRWWAKSKPWLLLGWLLASILRSVQMPGSRWNRRGRWNWSYWHCRPAFTQLQVAVAGGQFNVRSTAAHLALCRLVAVRAVGGDRKIRIQIAIGVGCGHGKAGVLRHRQRDVPGTVTDLDIAERHARGH